MPTCYGALVAVFLLLPASLHAAPLRECVRRTTASKPFAEMVFYADPEGKIAKIDLKYEGREPFAFHYLWSDGQLVAEKDDQHDTWNPVTLNTTLGFTEGFKRDRWKAEGEKAEGNASVSAAPIRINSATMGILGEQPWAIPGFSGTVRQVKGGVFRRRDFVYENGRMVRWIDQPRTGKYKKKTAELVWDSKDRLTSVVIQPRPKKGIRGYRFTWNDTRLRTVELLGKRKRYYRYKYDDAGRIDELVMEGFDKKPISFAYEYKCDDVRAHPAIEGIDLYQYSAL